MDMMTVDFITLTAFLTVIALIVMNDIKRVIRRESNKQFKAMVRLKYTLLSEVEFQEIYPELCRTHGFDEVE